jgi:hypothetical protein
LVSSSLPRLLGSGLTPEAVTVKLHSLTRLLAEIVNDHRLYSHLNDVCRVWAIQFSAKKFWKIVVNPDGSKLLTNV